MTRTVAEEVVPGQRQVYVGSIGAAANGVGAGQVFQYRWQFQRRLQVGVGEERHGAQADGKRWRRSAGG